MIIAKCIGNNGRSLSEFYFGLGYSRESVFDIAVGRVYPIYGMSIARGVLYYLVGPDGEYRPNWYPAILFEIVEGQLPGSWRFSFDKQNEEYGVVAIWGYDELVTVDTHYDGLIERNATDLQIFRKRRDEFDKQR